MPGEIFDKATQPAPPGSMNGLVDTMLIDHVQCGRFVQSNGSLGIYTETVPAQLTPQAKEHLTPERECDLINLYDQTKKSIDEVVVSRGQKQAATATAWAVSPNELVTNRHVVAGGDSIGIRTGEIRMPNGGLQVNVVPLQVENIRGDLALLKVPAGIKLNPLPLGESSSLTAGSPVSAIGHPRGMHEAFISPGTYAGTTSVTDMAQENEKALAQHKNSLGFGTGKDADQLRQDIRNLEAAQQTIGWLSGFELVLNMQILPGNSGGPLLDQQGRVVGVMNFAHGPEQSDAIPVEEVKALLEDTRKKSPSTAVTP